MRFLYLVLRLFKCPHKYIPLRINGRRKVLSFYEDKNVPDTYIYTTTPKECIRCGKVKDFKFKMGG